MSIKASRSILRARAALSFAVVLLAPARLSRAETLDIAALLSEAGTASPLVAAARSRTLAMQSTAPQAEALPDPMAGVSFTNVGFGPTAPGDDDDANLSLMWEQELPWPGRRHLAGEVARRETDEAAEAVRTARLDLRARLLNGWATLYRADGAASILAHSRGLLISLIETTRARYESGSGSLQEILKAQTEISRLDADRERYRQERLGAQAMMNALAGRRDNPVLGAVPDLPDLPEIDAEAQVTAALTGSPELREAVALLRREEARLTLARTATRPGLKWGAAYGYRGDLDPMITGSFGLTLPVWRARKQEQGIVEASHRVDAARLQAEAVRLNVAAAVRDLASRAERAATLTRLYADAAVPQARSAFEAAAAGYAVGRSDFLSVLIGFNTLFGYEQEMVVQRQERIEAFAALERVAGVRLIPAGDDWTREEGK